MAFLNQEHREQLIARIADSLLKGKYDYSSQKSLNIYVLGKSPDAPDMMVTIEWRERNE
jgi:hypothetical protein